MLGGINSNECGWVIQLLYSWNATTASTSEIGPHLNFGIGGKVEVLFASEVKDLKIENRKYLSRK
jgi:hypothetical protein